MTVASPSAGTSSAASRTRRAPAPPRWFLSLRSPYSWLALHDAVTRYPELVGACRWSVFFEPSAATAQAMSAEGITFPYVAMSRAKHLYILRDVGRLCAERGLVPTWPQDRDPEWETASLAVVRARELGTGQELDLAVRLTRARWQEGRDITTAAVVRDCVRECGLPDEVSEGDPEASRALALAELRDVADAGVFGVPFLVVGRQPFWGLDRLRAAADEFERTRAAGAASGPTPAPPAVLSDSGAPERSLDGGHAGGCG